MAENLFFSLLVLFLAGINFCCASAPYKPAPDTWPIIAASNKLSSGQLCPVIDKATGKVWLVTAAHVVGKFPLDKNVPAIGLRFIDLDTDQVVDAKVVWIDPIADIAYLKPTTEIDLHPYEIAEKRPNIGDSQWFAGYNLEDPRAIFERTIHETKVVMITGGDFTYHPGGKPGSSGSCLVNAEGKVDGINTSRFEFLSNASESAGKGADFWEGIAFRGLEEALARAQEQAEIYEALSNPR